MMSNTQRLSLATILIFAATTTFASSKTQNTSNPSNCAHPISLLNHQSCVLQLDINGTASTPLDVSLTTTPPPMVAAGAYLNGTSLFPLLATSTDGGTVWSYTVDSFTPVLPGLSLGEFRSANCSGQHCVAAGYYENGPDFYPLLATSTNAGQTWNYTIDSNTPTLADLIKGYFNSASCSGQNCIAAGQYRTSTTDYPLLATSSDGGLTWNYTVNGTTPALADLISGQFYSASCSGQNCIAAGSYYTATNIYPLLATSTDAGANWNYTINSTTPMLPSDLLSGQFNSTSCSGQNCVAAGAYDTSISVYPLLATSTNAGVTWNYTITNNTLTPPSGTQFGFFNSANCSGQSCIAAGFHHDTHSGHDYPLLASSTDGGATWNYTINKTTQSAPGLIDGRFVSASCSGQSCIAAGHYFDITGINTPLLATSTDGGVTWSYTINKTTPSLPSDLVSGFFSSTSCNGQYCIAAGQYITSTSQYPLLATSTDAGLTWAYTIDSTTPSLPSDYVSQGIFASTAISTSASLLPESLNFLKPQALSGY